MSSKLPVENEHGLSPVGLEQLRNTKTRMSRTPIEWTGGGFVWNVCTGCPGAYGASAPCDYCYANKKANNPFYRKAFPNKFNVTYHANRLMQPFKEKDPAIIFADSMSDLFSNGIKPKWVQEVLDVICLAHQHQFVILTKSPENIEKYLYGEESGGYLGGGDYIENVIIGVSVDRANAVHRIDTLKKFKKHCGGGWHLAVSFEPLLERMPNDIEQHIKGLEWVIIGQRTKPFNNPPAEWVQEIVDCCENLNIPYFIKNNLIQQGYYPAEVKSRYQKYPLQMQQIINRRR